MWDFNIRPYLLLMIGFMFLIIGPLNALIYQRPSEVGIDIFLIVAGVASVLIAYFNLPIEDRMYIRDLPSKLGITRERFVYCVDCRHYLPAYVYSLSHPAPKGPIYKGSCLRKRKHILDGFSERKCYYFKRREVEKK